MIPRGPKATLKPAAAHLKGLVLGFDCVFLKKILDGLFEQIILSFFQLSSKYLNLSNQIRVQCGVIHFSISHSRITKFKVVNRKKTGIFRLSSSSEVRRYHCRISIHFHTKKPKPMTQSDSCTPRLHEWLLNNWPVPAL